MIQFTVFGEPVAKGRPRSFRTKGGFTRTYTPEKTRKAEEDLNWQAIQHRPAAPSEGALWITIDVFRKPPGMSKKKLALALARLLRPIKRPDSDNYEKLVLDALDGAGFFIDDAQFCDVHTRKWFGLPARIEISMGEIDAEGQLI
ncbi:MAG: RusA family crossover junction endodeoxyribonuclease [Gammaproteobacteria bacterium]|nr:RusA family crossover junction endodeoxyribonuclease [Gammaproteobacteria bacterium]